MVCMLALGEAMSSRGQTLQSPKVEVAITMIGERSLRSATSDNFWMEGGAIELGTNSWRGFGVAAKVSGTHASAIGGTTIPLSLVTVTFGPRYRWHADHRRSIYCEGLIGEADGFKSLFPAVTGAQNSANSFASEVGGGLDYKLSELLTIRVLEAGWQHTQLPNGTKNVQNDLRLGAGLAVRFGH